MKRSEWRAVFSGHFNPFHNGHAYVIEKSLEIADTITVYISSRNMKDDIKLAPNVRAKLIETWIEQEGYGERVMVNKEYGLTQRALIRKEHHNSKICGIDKLGSYLREESEKEVLGAITNFIVVGRAHTILTNKIIADFNELGKTVVFVPESKQEERYVSSAGILERISLGKDISKCVPGALKEDVCRIYEGLIKKQN